MKKLLLLFTFLGAFVTSNAQGLTCATATTLTAGNYNYGAITGTYQAGCWTTGATNGVWYVYTPASNGYITINTDIASNAASADSRVSVFTGTCASLTCFTASDDVSDTNYRTNFGFHVTGGTAYYIVFDNRWTPDADNLNFDFSFVAANCNNALPYVENWTPIANFACWTTQSTDALAWGYNNGNDFNGDLINDPVALIFPTATNNAPKNDWLISKALTLNAGSNYNVSVKYNGFNAPATANESLRVVMLDAPSSTATFNQQIGSVAGIVQNGLNVSDLLPQATTQTYAFSPTTTGTYYAGIHANTPTAAGIIIIFEAKVEQNLSLSAFSAADLKVYPNPTKDILFVSNSLETAINSIQISDLNGRIVKSQNINAAEGQVAITDLASGIYMMTIAADQGTVIKKIIKE